MIITGLLSRIMKIKTKIFVAIRRAVRGFILYIPGRFAAHRAPKLDFLIKAHKSLLLRELKGVDLTLQRNKVVNLRLATEKINGVVIHPGKLFSLWRLVGEPTARKGYLPGLVLVGARLTEDVGGGLCQLANMLYWLALHSPLTIFEHHHHSLDIFPDEKRVVPFGTGCSIYFNYIDLVFKNNTDLAIQLLVWLDDVYLRGEIRTSVESGLRYHIEEEGHRFVRAGDGQVYRENELYQRIVDVKTGNTLSREKINENHSRVMYEVNGSLIY